VADIAEPVLRDLYAGPPEGFVAARDAAVTTARESGDRALATAIGKLRKPTVGAWLVNLLAWHAADDLAALYAVGDDLRAAQRDLRGGDLRQLSARRRTTVDALVTRARALVAASDRPGGEAGLPWDEVTATLNAVLSDSATAEAVRAGRLTRTTTYAGFGEFPSTAWSPADQPTEPTHGRPQMTSTKPAAAEATQTKARQGKATRATEAAGATQTEARRAEAARAAEAAEEARAEARAEEEARAAEAARAEASAAEEAERAAREAYETSARAEEHVRDQLTELERTMAELRERKARLQAELTGHRTDRQAAQHAVTAATRRRQRAADNLRD
jgi:hypothetical protein